MSNVSDRTRNRNRRRPSRRVRERQRRRRVRSFQTPNEALEPFRNVVPSGESRRGGNANIFQTREDVQGFAEQNQLIEVGDPIGTVQFDESLNAFSLASRNRIRRGAGFSIHRTRNRQFQHSVREIKFAITFNQVDNPIFTTLSEVIGHVHERLTALNALNGS